MQQHPFKRNRLIQRGLVGWVLLGIWIVADASAFAAEAAGGNAPPATHGPVGGTNSEIQALIEQLAADDYRARESASAALVDLGTVALPYLEEAAENPVLEINTRAERIRAIVSQQSFEKAVKAFVADADGRLGTSLPGWERARARLGSGADARHLFAEMYRAEPELLQAYGESVEAALTALTIRIDELSEEHSRTYHANYRLRSQVQQRISANVMACLFVGADERWTSSSEGQSSQRNRQEGANEAPELSSTSASKFKGLLQQSLPPNRFATAPEREHLREWLASWILHQFGRPHREHEGILLGMQYDIPQTLKLALRVLQRGESHPFAMYAVLCVGKYGEERHLSLLEPLLADDTRVQERHIQVNNQMVRYRVELRDVVLYVLVYRTGQDPKEYAFQNVNGSDEYLFLPHTIVFEEPASRPESIAKWVAWRKQHALFAGEPPHPELELVVEAEEGESQIEGAPPAPE